MLARKPLTVVAALLIGLTAAALPTGAADAQPRPFSVRQSMRHEPLHWGDSPTGEGSKIIFRYRPDGIATSAGGLVGDARVESTNRPAPFGTAAALRLDGKTGAFVADGSIATRSDVGATIEVWFRPSTSNRTGTLFSNRSSTGGMDLVFRNGRIAATFTTKTADGHSVQHTMASRDGAADPSRWHVAALTVDVTNGASARSRLYLDNRQITRTACGTDSRTADGACRLTGNDLSLQNSATHPVVGAAPGAGGRALNSAFGGRIKAAQVSNWPVDHDTLSTPAPRDGGGYFGRPDFFDQTPGVSESDGTAAAKWSDRTWDLARRQAWSDHGHPGSDTAKQTAAIDAGMAKVSARVGIGVLNDHYVPQGVSVSENGRVLSTIYYYADDSGANPVDGACGAESCPDVITRTDLSTMKMLGIYLLSDQNGEPFGRQGSSYHANGLVDAGGHLYAALATRRNKENHIVEGAVYRFRPSDAKLASPADATFGTPPVYRLTADATYPVASSGGSMSYAPKTHTLYLMGDYQPESMATTDNPGGDRPADGDILGYRLDSSGAIAHPSVTTADERIQLPRTDLQAYNQGQAWVGTRGDQQCFILSRSEQYAHTGHSNPQQPSDWELEPMLEWAGQLTSWCGNATSGDPDFTIRAVLPAGVENTALGPDGTLWTLSESGSFYYQRRTNHQEWYPFLSPDVLGIPLARLRH